MARTYKRDSRGRFAGGGGSSGSRPAASPTKPRKPRGLVPQRQAVARGKAKLAAKEADPAAPPRSRAAQKGALTKARNKLAAAKESGTHRTMVRGRTGVIRVRRRGKGEPAPQTGPASGIRPISARLQTSRQIGLSPREWLAQEERNGARYGGRQGKPKPRQRPAAGPPRNRIVPYEPQTAGGLSDAIKRSARRRGAKPGNSIRAYKPATTRSKGEALERKVKRTAKALSDNVSKLRESTDPLVSKFRKMQLKNARDAARDLVNKNSKGSTGDVARFMLREIHSSRDLVNARAVIARRAQRAAAAAARGSKAAARAAEIYSKQLAPVLPKGKGKGKNNIQPGPRNTKGRPKRRRSKR